MRGTASDITLKTDSNKAMPVDSIKMAGASMNNFSTAISSLHTALTEFSVTITVGDVDEPFFPYETNGHTVEEHNNHFYCEHCNRSPLITRGILEEELGDDHDHEGTFQQYVIGYFESFECTA